MQVYPYKIAAHLVTCLVNGDHSHLNADESRQVYNFENQVFRSHGAGHWYYSDEYDEDYGKCELSGKHGQVKALEWRTLV